MTDASARGVALDEIVALLDAELQVSSVGDYSGAVNGLQFANSGRVFSVATAVDISTRAIDAAAAAGASLLIVHHGLFWSGVQPVVGRVYERYRKLMQHDIAVYASHLPLDAHEGLGNNVRLAQALGLAPAGRFARFKTVDIGVQGKTNESTSDIVQRVAAFVAQYDGVVRTSVPVQGRRTRKWGICTGGGASSETIAEALHQGIDTIIVGEGPHHTTVDAIEHDLCVVYAGHYATETLGVQALGAFLETRFGLPWSFLNLPTGS